MRRKLPSQPDLERAVLDSGLTTTSLHFADVAEAARLPLHHADPFDRMVVAQARVRGLSLVTTAMPAREHPTFDRQPRIECELSG